MGEEQEQRTARKNHLLFRAVNEQIVKLTEHFRLDLSDLNLVCECWDPTCTGSVRVRLEDYERFDRTGSMFIVLPGHEDLRVEDVVDQVDAYVVVRKRDLT